MIDQDKPQSSNNPRFYYGYIVVAAAFFIMLISSGTYDSFGVFLMRFLRLSKKGSPVIVPGFLYIGLCVNIA